MLLQSDPKSVLLISWWGERDDGEIRIGHPLGRAAKGRCSLLLYFPYGTRRQLCSTKLKITPELLYKTIKIRLNRFSPFVLSEISNHPFDLPVFPSPITDDFHLHEMIPVHTTLLCIIHNSIQFLRLCLHSTLIRRENGPRSFSTTLIKLEEFENAGFSFSCGQKTFWERNALKTRITSRERRKIMCFLCLRFFQTQTLKWPMTVVLFLV